MAPSLRGVALAAGCALLAWSSPALAQLPGLQLPSLKPGVAAPASPAPGLAPPPAAAPAPSPPQAIPVAEIPTRIDQALDRLRHIRSQVPATAAVKEAEARFAQEQDVLRQMREGPEGQVDPALPLRELDDRRREWSSHRERLLGWRRVAEIEASDLGTSAEALRDMRATWQKTLEAAERQRAARPLTVRIRALLAEIDEVDAALQPRLAAVLGLQDRISRERAAVLATLEAIDQARTLAEQRLFVIESRPLWEALGSHPEWAATGHQVRATLEATGRALRGYWSGNIQRFVTHLLVLAALLAGFLYQSWRSRGWDTADGSLRVARHILRRPVASALLIALVATGRVHAGAPEVVGQLAGLAMFAPMIRILSGLLDPGLRPVLFALGAVYVLDTLGGFVPEHSLLDRLFLTAVTLLGLASLGWAAWRHQATLELLGGGWGRAAVLATRLAVLGLAFSLALNLVGNVSMANLLADGVLRSAYVAAVLLAAALVVEAAVTGLLRSRLAAGRRLVRVHGERLRQRAAATVRLLATLLWGLGTLFAFGILHASLDVARSVLGARWTVGSTSLSLGDAVAFVAVLGGALLLSRVIRFVLEEGVLPELALPRGVPGAVSMLVRYALVALGFVLAVGAAGVEMTRFTLLASALGVGVGFGLQNVVNNFISGLILAFERPIQVGDVVDLGTMMGEVRRIGIRSSHVRTFDGADVVVPNSNIIANQITNWTLSDRLRRQEITVGVAYGSDPRRVLEILHGAARGHPDVSRWPEPVALFRGFGASSLDFLLWCWAPFEKGVVVKSEVALAIHDALAAAGIVIPFPQLDLHVKPEAGALPRAPGPPPSG